MNEIVIRLRAMDASAAITIPFSLEKKTFTQSYKPFELTALRLLFPLETELLVLSGSPSSLIAKSYACKLLISIQSM